MADSVPPRLEEYHQIAKKLATERNVSHLVAKLISKATYDEHTRNLIFEELKVTAPRVLSTNPDYVDILRNGAKEKKRSALRNVLSKETYNALNLDNKNLNYINAVCEMLLN